MKKASLTFAVLMSCVFFAHSGEVRITLPPETAKLKPAPGSELVSAQCLLCHSADYISTQPRLSATAWKATVIKMRDKYAAPITEDKIDALVAYLAANYGAPAANK